MMVRCYWCISILIIIPTIRCCSLTGPFCGWSAVVFSDRRYPSFWNFDSAISIDVIRMKSYMDSLSDPTCVPVRVTINKLNFFPNRKMSRFVSVFRNCGGLRVGVSEVLRRCLQQQGVRTVFKSDTTLRSHLVRPKDTLEPTKQDVVVL